MEDITLEADQVLVDNENQEIVTARGQRIPMEDIRRVFVETRHGTFEIYWELLSFDEQTIVCPDPQGDSPGYIVEAVVVESRYVFHLDTEHLN